MHLIIGLAAIAVIAWLIHIADKRKESADDRRTKKLIECARRLYPHNALTESLGDLHKQITERIVQANLQGHKIDRLWRDRELIAAEVCRIWREESERKKVWMQSGGSFKVIRSERTPRLHASAR